MGLLATVHGRHPEHTRMYTVFVNQMVFIELMSWKHRPMDLCTALYGPRFLIDGRWLLQYISSVRQRTEDDAKLNCALRAKKLVRNYNSERSFSIIAMFLDHRESWLTTKVLVR